MSSPKRGLSVAKTVRKVLLADDEAQVLDLLQATLASDPRYTLLVARNGDEALDLCRQEHPDLVFLDVVMPRRNGYVVCKEIKGDPSLRDTKVVMLSAMAQGADLDNAMRAGADGYVTKPFSPTALLQKVEGVLGLPPNE